MASRINSWGRGARRLICLLVLVSAGCTMPDLATPGAEVEVFENEEVPQTYQLLGEVEVSEKFESQRVSRARLVDLLKARAVESGATAISEIRLDLISQESIIRTPRYVLVYGRAKTHREQPASESDENQKP